jgi:hypothetical protein
VSRKLRERMLARHVPSLRVAVMMVWLVSFVLGGLGLGIILRERPVVIFSALVNWVLVKWPSVVGWRPSMKVSKRRIRENSSIPRPYAKEV